MNRDIQELIENIKKTASRDEAIFIIQQNGGGSDESFALANNDGLLLFAAEILEAYLSHDNQPNITFKLNGPNELYADGDTIIDHIQYTNDKRKSFQNHIITNGSWPFIELVQKIGCAAILLIIALIFLAGIKFILTWF